MKRTLGVCYYPEHWSEEIWATDAKRMVETGLTWVRIGEFAWSRMEPAPGEVRVGLVRSCDRGAWIRRFENHFGNSNCHATSVDAGQIPRYVGP